MTRKFLTPKRLKITAGEHKWLIATADLLYKMNPEQKVKIPNDGVFMFDMSTVARAIWTRTNTVCGTAGCILGCARILAVAGGDMVTWRDSFYACDHSKALTCLFYPLLHPLLHVRGYGVRDGYDYVTPRIAANATYRFLQTGRICYPKSVGGKGVT